jgi:hypothetical protein
MTPSTGGSEALSLVSIGWELLVRVHGVSLSSPIRLRIEHRDVDPPIEVLLDLTESPPYSMRFDVPSYFVIGEPALPVRQSIPPTPRSAWLSLVVSRAFPVDARLAEEFHQRPDDSRVMDRLGDLLSSQFEDLRAMADLCAGAFLTDFAGARAMLWHDARRFWQSPSEIGLHAVAPLVTAIAASTITTEELIGSSARMYAACSLTGRERVAVQLCSRWLLNAHGMHDSNERFMLCFQCLEALTSLEDQSPTAEDSRGFALLDALAATAPEESRAETLAYLGRLRGRMSKPSFPDRFARLATRFSGTSATEDVVRLRAINRARNDYVHAKVDAVPPLRDGVPVHQAVHEMALKYLRLVVDSRSQPSGQWSHWPRRT